MTDPRLVFLASNIICAVGTSLQIHEIIKNRDILRGYKFLGSLLTLIAVIGFQYGFLVNGLYESVAFGMITVAFWLLATLFSGLQKWRRIYYKFLWAWDKTNEKLRKKK